jgi:hypothetical protein
MSGGEAIPLTLENGSVIKEILDTPFIKEMLWNFLVDTNPKNGAKLVRDLLWEDVGVILSLVDGMPAIINYLTGALSELVIQAEEKFPPAMLLAIIQALKEHLDTEPLKKASAAAMRLAQGLIKESGTDLPAAAGKSITALARSFNAMHAQDPTRIPAVVSTVMANIDSRELSLMTSTILNTILNQRPPLISWAARMLRGRVKERVISWKNRRYNERHV